MVTTIEKNTKENNDHDINMTMIKVIYVTTCPLLIVPAIYLWQTSHGNIYMNINNCNIPFLYKIIFLVKVAAINILSKVK